MALVGFVGLGLLVGAADGTLTAAGARAWYLSLTPPPGTPPTALFGPVWTLLYLLMGTAAWLVWRQVPPPGAVFGKRAALRLWGWQLLLNAAWTPAFFGLHSPGFSLLVMLALAGLIGLTIRAFGRIHRPAAALLLPYALWMCYAGYLNAGFFWLNPG
jgi:tryptophan-rich sensory protein